MEPIMMVHGGACDIPECRIPLKHAGVKKAVQAGYVILQNGGSAVDAVEAAVKSMKLDETFNAGYGSVLNVNGEVEMDASIMNGSDMNFGSVTCVKDISHPVSLARMVMERTPHVMIAAEGANKFATENRVPVLPKGSLVTEYAKNLLEHFKKTNKTEIGIIEDASKDIFQNPYCEVDTVGAVALDKDGRLAAATSTGGISGKMVGRSSDASMVGCGTYADNNVGAVSLTGHGESISKFCLAHSIIKEMEYTKKSPKDATDNMLQKMADKFKNTAGAITVSNKGDIGIGFTSKHMSWAYIKGSILHYGIKPNEDITENA